MEAAPKEELRPASDVNLILVLSSFDAAEADRIREPFAAARAAIQLTAMFLLEHEVPQAILSFGQKFPTSSAGIECFTASIHCRRARTSCRGNTSPEASPVKHDAAPSRRVCGAGTAPERIAALIADAAGPLRSCAATLLELEGKPPLPPKEALIAIVTGFQESGWDEVLAHVSDAGRNGNCP